MSEIVKAQSSQDLIDKARKIQSLQEQLTKVKKVMGRSVLYAFIVGAVGGFFYGAFTMAFPPGTVGGFTIFSVSIGFGTLYVMNAKKEYRKLLEQLQQTFDLPTNFET
jgi:uncharacterized membrane protein (DUF485 family)